MTELLLIRHGESESNATGLVQGQFDAHLSERGREQARRLARRLALQPPDVLFCSDLSRAFETARAVAEACKLELHPEPRLREIDMGRWVNQRWEDLARLYPDEWAKMLAGDPDFQRGGGESKVMLQQRTVAAIDEIVAAQAGKRVAIVSHGGTIRTYLAYVLEMPLQRIFTRFRLGNTAICTVRLPQDGTVPTLVSLNDTAHLEAWATL